LPEVLERAAARGVDRGELGRLRDWLASSPDNLVDQKRLDAVALLERVRDDSRSTAARSEVTFEFEYTELWHEFTRRIGAVKEAPPSGRAALPTATPAPEAAGEERRRAHLRSAMVLLSEREPALAADLYREAERRAALLECATATGLEAAPAQVQTASDELRLERNLLSPASTQRWLEERGLDILELSVWMQEEVLLRRARERAEPGVEGQLLRVLHASDEPAVRAAFAETAGQHLAPHETRGRRTSHE
jgi:hypothetical protein